MFHIGSTCKGFDSPTVPTQSMRVVDIDQNYSEEKNNVGFGLNSQFVAVGWQLDALLEKAGGGLE